MTILVPDMGRWPLRSHVVEVDEKIKVYLGVRNEFEYFCNRGHFYRVHGGQMQAHVKFKLSATLTQLLSLLFFFYF